VVDGSQSAPSLLSLEVSLLGRSEDSELYEDLDEYENLAAPAGVRVFRFQAPLYYANKDSFLRTLYETVGVDPFLEMTSRRKRDKKATKRLAAKQAGEDSENHKNGKLCVGLVRRELEFHTIVLDCSAIPFIDSAGMGAFAGLVKDYGELGVTQQRRRLALRHSTEHVCSSAAARSTRHGTAR
jgi:hypothetical protein